MYINNRPPQGPVPLPRYATDREHGLLNMLLKGAQSTTKKKRSRKLDLAQIHGLQIVWLGRTLRGGAGTRYRTTTVYTVLLTEQTRLAFSSAMPFLGTGYY